MQRVARAAPTVLRRRHHSNLGAWPCSFSTLRRAAPASADISLMIWIGTIRCTWVAWDADVVAAPRYPGRASFPLATLGHACAELKNLHVAPYVLRPLRGDGAALAEGGRARDADFNIALRPDPWPVKPVGMVRLGEGR